MADILRSNFVVTVRAATLLVAMDSAGTALLTKQRRKILRSEQKCYGRLLSKIPKISPRGWYSRTPARTLFSNPFDACALKRDQNMLSIKGEDTM